MAKIQISRLASFIASNYLREQGNLPRFATSALDFAIQSFIPPEIKQRGEIGEELVVASLKDFGYDVERNRHVELNIGADVLHGYIDIYIPSEDTIVEVKTMSESNDLSYYAAVVQASLYALTFDKPQKILIATVLSDKSIIPKSKEQIVVVYTIKKVEFHPPDEKLIEYSLQHYVEFYERLKLFLDDVNVLLARYGFS